MHGAARWWFGHRGEGHSCGPRGHGRGHGPHWGGGGGGGGGGPWGSGGPDGGGFGVRRPLRFLVHKLELSDKQAAQLAKIIDELKTERAQAEVDERRSTASLADAVSSETFDDAAAEAATKRRTESAERVAGAVRTALREIHALLDPEQREIFAYLIRSGALGI
jgi:Spy/CpxP family protein refolding chaperone